MLSGLSKSIGMKPMTKNYHEIKDLINRLRFGNCPDPIVEEAANELERIHDLLCKQQVIIRRVFAETLPDTWFVAGEMGNKDSNGLPDRIEVCPAYGVGWTQIYEKTDRTISTEGS